MWIAAPTLSARNDNKGRILSTHPQTPSAREGAFLKFRARTLNFKLRCGYFAKGFLVFKSSLHEDGASASDDEAVFAYDCGAVVVVVVIVESIK